MDLNVLIIVTMDQTASEAWSHVVQVTTILLQKIELWKKRFRKS